MKNLILPLCITLYCWFICANAVAILIFSAISAFYPVDISLLGIKSEPFSVLGIVIVLISIFKGLLAYFMLRRNILALRIGLIDSILSLLTIVFVSVYPFIGYPEVAWERRISFEIIFIIIYLVYMVRINKSIRSLKFADYQNLTTN